MLLPRTLWWKKVEDESKLIGFRKWIQLREQSVKKMVSKVERKWEENEKKVGRKRKENEKKVERKC